MYTHDLKEGGVVSEVSDVCEGGEATPQVPSALSKLGDVVDAVAMLAAVAGRYVDTSLLERVRKLLEEDPIFREQAAILPTLKKPQVPEDVVTGKDETHSKNNGSSPNGVQGPVRQFIAHLLGEFVGDPGADGADAEPLREVVKSS